MCASKREINNCSIVDVTRRSHKHAAPALVAQSPADGYMLLVNTSAQAYSAAALQNLPYDPLNGFIPVAPLTSQPYLLVAGSSSHITSVRDLIVAAKAKPGELKFGSAGIGTGTHLGAEKFNLATGIKAVHVPGNTTPGAIADMVAAALINPAHGEPNLDQKATPQEQGKARLKPPLL